MVSHIRTGAVAQTCHESASEAGGISNLTRHSMAVASIYNVSAVLEGERKRKISGIAPSLLKKEHERAPDNFSALGETRPPSAHQVQAPG